VPPEIIRAHLYDPAIQWRMLPANKVSEVTNLGILIEPAEVRLITRADDPYTWQMLPEKEHLFKKHLSKHSIGAYRELCRGVGVSFDAVLAPESSNAGEMKPLTERRGVKVGVTSLTQS
jgi:hypothetical protein